MGDPMGFDRGTAFVMYMKPFPDPLFRFLEIPGRFLNFRRRENRRARHPSFSVSKRRSRTPPPR
jgi:hypothetical protein